MSPETAIIISVVIAVFVGGFWHYMSSRELRKGFAKMDERFEQLIRTSFEGHTKILEAIKESGRRSSEQHTKILEAIRELAKT